MVEFKLSAQLKGHDADVRAAAFPSADLVLSSSRDHTVRVWRNTGGNPPDFEGSITTQGHDFINALAYVPPSPAHPDGLIVSGGKDTIIQVKKPTSTPADKAERLLRGHAHNICALDVAPGAKWLVSGAWDGQARVWSLAKWETELVLNHDDGGGGSVWAVVAYNDTLVITGCADSKIRIFDLSRSKAGAVDPISTMTTPAVVRALCKLPSSIKSHARGADFASASNDGIIRLWKTNGKQLGELHGHDSFIYSLASLSTGEIVSAGEDRTLRIWSDLECIQTITHPAISVWTVAVCPDTDDIVSGASDNVVRVFTRSQDRVAGAHVIAQFEETVRTSAIPQQQLGGGINKEKLDPPDWLQLHNGTKEGQVKMIREDNGSISAHQWSIGQQQWINVGTVVDSAGSSGRKVEYQGKEYDYVFDVDIEDGKPPLKLPYNLSDNVYDTATNFLGHNNLPLTYLDNVANFITENTKGATIGQSSGPSAPDPFGSEKRYKPGQGEPGVQRKRQLPHKEFLTITQAKFEPIQNKILSLNANLMSAGSKHIALNPSETRILARLVAALNAPASSGTPPNLPEASVDLVVKLVTQWPYSDRLPGLDLLRLMATSPEVAKLKTSEYESVTDMVLASSLDTDGAVNENSVMMAMRTIANLFASDEGRAVAAQHADTVVGAMERVAGIVEGAPPIGAQNRNVQIALASAAFNYALLAYLDQQEGGPAEPRVGPYVVALLCNVLGRVLHDQADAEVVFRALVALGTVLVAGGEGRATARELGAAEWLRRAVARASEDRVKSLARECLAFL